MFRHGAEAKSSRQLRQFELSKFAHNTSDTKQTGLRCDDDKSHGRTCRRGHAASRHKPTNKMTITREFLIKLRTTRPLYVIHGSSKTCDRTYLKLSTAAAHPISDTQ